MRWDGRALSRALEAATRLVELRAAQINALNVFPVPDGDTGTNMALTMRAALREVEALANPTLGEVARAAARGALFGARGNSGVVTSRYLHGFAEAVAAIETIGSRELAAALRCASETAYRAVAQPVEGTMLTVSKDAADAASAAAENGGTVEIVLEAAVQAARESVARTPSLLPVLRQAGVVDAGGEGLCTILEGFAQALIGATVALPAADSYVVAAKRVEVTEEYGYCTEFLLRGEDLVADRFQRELAEFGNSLVVAGEGDLLRIHIHTDDPGRVLSYAVGFGSLLRVSIENMQEQYERLIANSAPQDVSAVASGASTHRVAVVDREMAGSRTGHADASVHTNKEIHDAALGLAVVVVASGPGFQDLFRSLGATTVISGGQSMNPSIEELLHGIAKAPSDQVILIPNNSNILLAAQQAKLLTRKRVEVIPTRNMAEGVAALLALNYDADLEANALRMERAAQEIGSAEISRAVRTAKIGRLRIRKGDAIGLIGGHVVAVGADPITVAIQLVEQLGGDDREVVTVYYGEGVDDKAVQGLVDAVRARWPALQVETLDGGQPSYSYILSAE